MNWGELLMDALSVKADEIPRGWSTANQIAEETGNSGSHVRAQLCAAVKQGKVERKDFRILINGRVRAISHYREKK